jgi:glycerate kinase
MKIVVAMDSFKGSLKAHEACQVVSNAVREALSDVKIVTKPMADGGEGTARAMIETGGGLWIPRMVMGPLRQMQVEAGFAWFADGTALVEMASASGLELLKPEQFNPLKTTTYGTGQLMKAAARHGAQKILLAVGGSATVDSGVGAAMALGWQFRDHKKNPVPLGGGGLEEIAEIIRPGDSGLGSRASGLEGQAASNEQVTGRQGGPVEVEVLSDVDNPLCGPNGAAEVYGPQKGATPQMVNRLDKGLAHLAKLVREQLGKEIESIPGAGAAGGLAAGAVAFMDAKIVSGIETVMVRSNLRAELESADWVVTGEGSFDRQSLSGKVISGMLKMARQTDTRVGIIAGQLNIPQAEYEKLGISGAVSAKPDRMPLAEALAKSRPLLASAAKHFAKKYLVE